MFAWVLIPAMLTSRSAMWLSYRMAWVRLSACWFLPRAKALPGLAKPAPMLSPTMTKPSKIQGGWTDFDVAIATPDLMGKVGAWVVSLARAA
jgi:hypothetical protein